jgi:hypothetical protein
MPKRLLASALVIAVLLALAALLNPSPERHRAKIKQAIAQRSPLAGAVGIGALTAFTSSYHSLGVASYTTAGDKTLSYGAFGFVVVAD